MDYCAAVMTFISSTYVVTVNRPDRRKWISPDQNLIVRTDTAVKDVGSAVELIRKRRGVASINLLGWSWGTSIMDGTPRRTTTRLTNRSVRAGWLRNTPSLTDSGDKLGAYRASLRLPPARWSPASPKARKRRLSLQDARGVNSHYRHGSGRLEIESAHARAPNGVVQDGVNNKMASRSTIQQRSVPTLLVHAEWDQDLPSYMLYAYFEKLTNAPYKRYVQIGGTHTVIMEKNRMLLFEAVQHFLDENLKPDMFR
jgi:pimeloyl-ACP methyl ester carboxylesterase